MQKKGYGLTFITIATGFAVALFAWWLNRETFDVRFTLSEQIPLKIVGQQASEGVQQLTVKNLGNRSVEKIQVKMLADLVQTELVKCSQADVAQSFSTNGMYELMYPRLPPEGLFRLIFRTPGKAVTKADLEVRHDRGIATEALSRGTSSNVWLTALFALIVCVYSLLTLNSLRSIFKESWTHRSEFHPEIILKRRKPIYLSGEGWDEIRKKALRHLPPRSSDASGLYRFLDGNKPVYLSDEEWKGVLGPAVEAYVTRFTSEIEGPWTSSATCLRLLNTKKPVQFPDEQWDELRAKLEERYFERKRREAYGAEWAAELVKTKPDQVTSSLWNEYRDDLQEKFSAYLLQKLELSSSPVAFLGAAPLTLLKAEQAEKLKERASRVQELDSNIRKARQEIEEGTAKLRGQQEELRDLKEKILRQLDFVDRFLKDPLIVERIEDYDNLFAPGNYQNLKKLAERVAGVRT